MVDDAIPLIQRRLTRRAQKSSFVLKPIPDRAVEGV